MEPADGKLNITDVLLSEVLEKIFSFLNHYELTAVRLVCQTFKHASKYEFDKKSRLVVNPNILPDMDHFMLNTNLQIQNIRLLNLHIDKSDGAFDCTNLASLPTTINDLEVVECPGMDEKTLLQICGRFTSMTIFSLINDTDDTEIDAAYVIAHLCGRLKALTLKIKNVTEHLEVPVITASMLESLTILHREHDVPEFEKSKLFAVIAAISKGLKHLSLDFWLSCWDGPGEYDDDAVTVLSELEWNLQSLELLIEPKDNSSRALQKWIEKIGASLNELTLHGNFLDLPYTAQEFYIFEWVCDNCPQLLKFMFICKDTEYCENCREYDFSHERLENLKKLTHLTVFKAPSRLKATMSKPTVEATQQLNSHLKHLEINLDPYWGDDLVSDLELLCNLRNLTNLKITREFKADPSIGEFISKLFEHFTSLQELSLDMIAYSDAEKCEPPSKENFHGADIRNLKQLRRIEIRNGHKCMGPWLSFQQLSEMPGLCDITFRDYKEILLDDIITILRTSTHLARIKFIDCESSEKWAAAGNDEMELQIMAAIPVGKKCLVKVTSS